MENAAARCLRTVKGIGYLLKQDIDRLLIHPTPTEMFGIRAGYRHRKFNIAYDDTPNDDHFQREVYETAYDEAVRLQATTVYDIGCGSGYKLVKYLSSFRTVGFELPRTVKFLRKRYPNREWRECNLNDPNPGAADILICADVIEHIRNPDDLLDFLAKFTFKRLFLSTPDRALMYGLDHSGPPDNVGHCREWTVPEFRAYVGRWFVIERHYISNSGQRTQLAICKAHN